MDSATTGNARSGIFKAIFVPITSRAILALSPWCLLAAKSWAVNLEARGSIFAGLGTVCAAIWGRGNSRLLWAHVFWGGDQGLGADFAGAFWTSKIDHHLLKPGRRAAPNKLPNVFPKDFQAISIKREVGVGKSNGNKGSLWTFYHFFEDLFPCRDAHDLQIFHSFSFPWEVPILCQPNWFPSLWVNYSSGDTLIHLPTNGEVLNSPGAIGDDHTHYSGESTVSWDDGIQQMHGFQLFRCFSCFSWGGFIQQGCNWWPLQTPRCVWNQMKSGEKS